MIVCKQAVSANRCSKQRSDVVSQRDQGSFGFRQNGTTSRENKWSLCTPHCFSKPAHILGIRLQASRHWIQFERRITAAGFCVLHIEWQTQHNGLTVVQGARHRTQQIASGRLRGVSAFGNGTNRAHKLGLLHIKIRFDIAGRHVSSKDQKRCAAFCGFSDPGDRIGETGSGVHTDKRQLPGRLGIGIRHAGGVALVTRGNEFNAGFDQSVRNLEIGGAKQAETATCPKRREILRQDCGDCRIIAQGWWPHVV